MARQMVVYDDATKGHTPAVSDDAAFATLAEVRAGVEDSKPINTENIAQAVQGNGWNYAVANGTANAITAAFQPAVTTHTVGAVYYVRAAADNTSGTVTFNPGAGAKPVTRLGGAPLQIGSIKAGMICELAYDGTQYQLVSANSVPSALLATNGYAKQPDGMIWQWGSVTLPLSLPTAASATVTFPVTFPASVFSVLLTSAGPVSTGGFVPAVMVQNITTANFKAAADTNGAKTMDVAPKLNWLAVGY